MHICTFARSSHGFSRPAKHLWDGTTPEKVLLVHVCVEDCITTNNQAKLEGSLPRDPPRLPDPKRPQQIPRNLGPSYKKCVVRARRQRDVDERFDDLLLDADFVIAEMFQLVPDMIMQGVGGKLYGGCCPQAREI